MSPRRSAVARAARTATPDQVVQGIADDLGKAIEGHQAELKNDREKLIKLIDGILLPHFDIDYASILVLGQYARTATPEQRARFAKAFYNSIAHRYAEGLLNYTRGRVRVLPSKGDTERQAHDRAHRSRARRRQDAAGRLRVPQDAGRHWKAYDVIIEGISYITNYRNQVGAEIQKSEPRCADHAPGNAGREDARNDGARAAGRQVSDAAAAHRARRRGRMCASAASSASPTRVMRVARTRRTFRRRRSEVTVDLGGLARVRQRDARRAADLGRASARCVGMRDCVSATRRRACARSRIFAMPSSLLGIAELTILRELDRRRALDPPAGAVVGVAACSAAAASSRTGAARRAACRRPRRSTPCICSMTSAGGWPS